MPSSIFLHPKAQEVFVELLIAARKKAGLKQSDISDRMDQPQQYVSRIESGRRRIDVIEFINYARAAEIDPVKLFAKAVKRLPE